MHLKLWTECAFCFPCGTFRHFEHTIWRGKSRRVFDMNEQEVFRTYIDHIRAWGVEMKAYINQISNPELEEGIDRLLDRLKSNETWKEEEIYEIQEIVDGLYRKADELSNSRQEGQSVPIGGHVLPRLPYAYNALEPYISEEIMRLHHTKHHQSYVDGLNRAEKMMQRAREKNDYDILKHWEREAAFHGSGHYLHTIFWNNMVPGGGETPSGDLLRQIERDFGSFDKFKDHFTEAAKSVEGVGWAILVWSPRSHRLEILQSEKHQLMTQWDTIPLLVLDVWEHAYYLQYKNERSSYIENWWNVVNWRDVERRYKQANKLRWRPS